VTTITQDVEDFMKSSYGKPIVTNSSMQILLKQAPSAMDMLQKVFNLTEGEKYMLLNSGIGQGLFFAGLKHVAIQIIASYTEDKIITTSPEEVLKYEKDQKVSVGGDVVRGAGPGAGDGFDNTASLDLSTKPPAESVVAGEANAVEEPLTGPAVSEEEIQDLSSKA